MQCCVKSPLSYKEQAEIVGCSERFVKKITKENVEKQIITKTPTIYRYCGRNRDGKNIYGRGKAFKAKIHLLDELELEIKKLVENDLNQKTPIPLKKIIRILSISWKSRTQFTPYKNNFSKEKFAKDKQAKPLHWEIFQEYGFGKFATKSPPWWLRDKNKLKKALKLLRSKIKRGFRPKNFFKFVSHLLSKGCFGYREKKARSIAEDLNNPTLETADRWLASEKIWQDYENLTTLYKKFNLDISPANFKRLLRKGYCHFTMAARVLLIRLKLPGVHNVNAFFDWLISQENPVDILRKNQ